LYWGSGIDTGPPEARNPDALYPTVYPGSNKLGHILMDVRNELLKQEEADKKGEFKFW